MSKTSRGSWKALEYRTARAVDGVRVPSSGGMKARLMQLAGDVINDILAIECKFSGSKDSEGNRRIHLKYEWFPKIIWEAENLTPARLPLMVIHFKNTQNDWAILPESTWQILTLPLFEPTKTITVKPDETKKSFTLYEHDLDLTSKRIKFDFQNLKQEWFATPFKVFLQWIAGTPAMGCAETLKRYTFLRQPK